jgi:hypothetical protein
VVARQEVISSFKIPDCVLQWHIGGVERAGYAQTRPYVVVDDLAELVGPDDGVVDLPLRLDWSGPRHYDLADDQDQRLLYETVLNQALDPADLRATLNAELLRGLWTRLWLPARVRQLWESRFQVLAMARAA